jgi:putative acetyltransferase
MIIRTDTPTDYSRIDDVVKSAFPGPDEAGLINRLRANGDIVISLVAVEDGLVVGHVLFSRMEAPFKALGLGPASVAPERQRNGIGSALVKEGIKRAADNGWQGIFVLGDPKFYQRFGFNEAAATGFSSPYAGPHFMALSLNVELPVKTGRVAYPPAFAALG